MKIKVIVSLNAKETRVLGLYDQALKVAIHAKPIDGAANKELIKILSAHFKVPKSQIKIISGLNSRRKIVEFPAL
jgi:uncharacterized protein (TIGR00251 family)